jgi:NTP pyrophosphatase (non-canonical NTP hydrolase)
LYEVSKLKSVIRHPKFNAEDFGGFLAGDFQFQRIFFLEEKSLKKTFDEVNIFLEENGYNPLDYNEFKEELSISRDLVSLSAHPYVNETNRYLVLTIKIFDPWDNPVDRVLVDLLQLKKARDWGQFHKSKDLALALSVEASELLELFLSKEIEEVNPEKLKEELADVFLYGLLLMEKYGFDFEEILIEKLQAISKKYPESKAKGIE